MVTIYNEEAEAYFQIFAGIVDSNDDNYVYDCTDWFIQTTKDSYDEVRKAHRLYDFQWETLKNNLNKWIDDYEEEYHSVGCFHSPTEERHFEIWKAVPRYDLIDLDGEKLCEGEWYPLDYVKSFIEEEDICKEYTAVPYPAEECGFRLKLERYSGKI